MICKQSNLIQTHQFKINNPPRKYVFDEAQKKRKISNSHQRDSKVETLILKQFVHSPGNEVMGKTKKIKLRGGDADQMGIVEK